MAKKKIKKSAKTKPAKKAAKKSKPAKKAAKSARAARPQLKTSAKVSTKTKKVTKVAPTLKIEASTRILKKGGLNLKPLDNRVVVEAAGFAEKTPGGLYIPEMALDRPLQGKVLAVGPGHRSRKGKLRPMDVQVGDEVIYAKYSGTKLELSGREVLVLREDEILGIVGK